MVRLAYARTIEIENKSEAPQKKKRPIEIKSLWQVVVAALVKHYPGLLPSNQSKTISIFHLRQKCKTLRLLN